MVTEVIVKQARNGDMHAFQMLYEDIYKDMYRVAYYLLGNREDAEDAVSEAVFDMYRQISGLRKCAAFKSWAMKILSVKCKLKIREYANYRAYDESNFSGEATAIEYEDQRSDGQDMESEAVLRMDIKQAMKVLSEEERMIVLYSVVSGMNSDEVGAITGLKSATVRSKLHRALGKLRKKMEVGV